MIDNNFTNIEIVILFLLLFSLLFPLRLINKFQKLSLVNPLIIYCLITSYYTIISPIYRLITNLTFDRGIEHRSLLIYGWTGCLVSLISLYFGYFFENTKSLKKNRTCNLNSYQLWNIGFWINNLGILGYLIFTGLNFSRFNPFIGEARGIDFLRYRGDFSSYLFYAQNFLITGNLLMVTSFFRNKDKVLPTLGYLIITIGLYLNSGYRYKLFFLTFSLFLFYFLITKFSRKIYFIYITISLFLFGFINSLLEIIRSYGSGFRLENLERFNLQGVFLYFFKVGESSVFLTTSALMSVIPSKVPYIYFYPFYKVLIHPIPSTFFNKDAGDYIEDALFGLYQSEAQVYGAAIHNFGEYYLMFGWLGIIIGSFLLGIILKKLWIWILIHQNEEIALPLYLLNISFIFMIISRGYLPQQFLLYAFSVLPINLIYVFNNKKIKTNNI